MGRGHAGNYILNVKNYVFNLHMLSMILDYFVYYLSFCILIAKLEEQWHTIVLAITAPNGI